MPASSRRYPFVGFSMDREPGKEILTVDRLSKSLEGVPALQEVSFTVNRGDKIAFVGENDLAFTALCKVLTEEEEPDGGSFKWGVSTSRSYFPQDNTAYFEGEERKPGGVAGPVLPGGHHRDLPAGLFGADALFG